MKVKNQTQKTDSNKIENVVLSDEILDVLRIYQNEDNSMINYHCNIIADAITYIAENASNNSFTSEFNSEALYFIWILGEIRRNLKKLKA